MVKWTLNNSEDDSEIEVKFGVPEDFQYVKDEKEGMYKFRGLHTHFLMQVFLPDSIKRLKAPKNKNVVGP